MILAKTNNKFVRILRIGRTIILPSDKYDHLLFFIPQFHRNESMYG